MAAERESVAIELPDGPEGIAALTAGLADALSGHGPALALLPGAGSAQYRARLRAAVRPGEPVPEEVALIAATSGSTGDPAGVLLPGSALQAAAAGFVQLVAGLPASDHPGLRSGVGGHAEDPGPTQRGGHRWVAALPLHHAGGFMVAVRAVLGGSLPVPITAAGGQARFTIEELDSATQAAAELSLADGRPLAISLVPAQLATLHDAGPRGVGLLRRFAVVLVGGAATPAPLLASLRAAGVRLLTSYGMTETCGGAVFDGRPLPGTIVSTDSAGRLKVSGRQVALGYRDGRQPQRWSGGPDGMRRFVTDDLGSVAPDGTIHVLGRSDDVVQVGGASVAVAAVAEVLGADPAVREVEVVAIEHPRLGTALVAFVAPTRGACTIVPPGAEPSRKTGRDGLAERLTARVVESLGTAARPRRVILLPGIPVAESGKRDRAALLDKARVALADER